MEEEGPPPWENWTFLPLNDLRFNSPQGMAIVGSMLYLADDGGPGAGNGEGFSRVYAIDLADSCRRKYVIRASGSRVAGPALRPMVEDPHTFPAHPEDALKCVRGITAHAGDCSWPTGTPIPSTSTRARAARGCATSALGCANPTGCASRTACSTSPSSRAPQSASSPWPQAPACSASPSAARLSLIRRSPGESPWTRPRRLCALSTTAITCCTYSG